MVKRFVAMTFCVILLVSLFCGPVRAATYSSDYLRTYSAALSTGNRSRELSLSFSAWEGIIEYVESRMDKATRHESVFAVIDAPTGRASATYLFKNKLRALHGDAYSDKKICTEVKDGQVFCSYESLNFSVAQSETVSWSNTYIIGLLLGNVFCIIPSEMAIQALLSVLGIVLSDVEASTEILPDKGYTYDCRATYTRYVKMNDSNRVWTQVSKTFNYTGAEAASYRIDSDVELLDAYDVEPRYYGETGNTEDYFNYGFMNHAYQIWKGGY